jgi:uncharacterized protein (DUF1330 family)
VKHDAYHNNSHYRAQLTAASILLVWTWCGFPSLAPAVTPIVEYQGVPYTGSDLYADTWVATDGLGRTLPDIGQCGPVKKEKWVGIFYWTWHTGLHHGATGQPADNGKLLPLAKDGRIPWPAGSNTHYWGEPELGYYRMTDPFVIRKHASMLVDAGIDVVLFDTTNPPHTFRPQYEALCREYNSMRKEGAATPSIGFITPFGNPNSVVQRLWHDLYQPGHWQQLWFQWDGKPLLLADANAIQDPQIKNFFTFRRPMPDYWLGPSGPDQWSWLEVHPQHVFKNSHGEAEQMSVGVGQNALPGTPGPAPMSHQRGAMGRSWHRQQMDLKSDAVNWGLNFREQWQRALDISPKFVFVTGWNEWIAGRYNKWSTYTDKDCYYPDGLFVDQYNQEYSRDCEPMRGGHTDNYYYQLASWVRRFKGVRPRPTAQGPSKIVIDGTFDDWQPVGPEYRDTLGDCIHRDHPGFGKLHYRNDTGRNDLVLSKSAFDTEHIYFFVQTLHPITPSTDPQWMLLLIDTDRNPQTGWLGYDILVNGQVANATSTSIQRWHNGKWREIRRAAYRVNGNGLELALPRQMIQPTASTDLNYPTFDFHWADNVQNLDSPSQFGVNGDSAPNRRWNYRYEVKKLKGSEQQVTSSKDERLYMLNVLWFKQEGGAEKYQEYIRAAGPYVAKHGGKSDGAYVPDANIIGEFDADLVFFVEWPNLNAFTEFIQDPGYQTISHLRTEAIRNSLLVRCKRK